MEFRILGSMEVLDGSRGVGLPAGRGRALLALLVLDAGVVVPADVLIDELWGEQPPPTASTVVQGLVSRLRKLLEPGRDKGEPAAILQTAGSGYRLAIDPLDVDAHRFQRMLDEARDLPAERRGQLLTDALALWRGPALADFRYEPFAQRAITALEELRLVATEDRIDADLAMGRHARLVAELEALTAAHPFRERLRGQLMLALYRNGRQADALAAFQTARGSLVDELGIEPGPEMRRLEQAILRQDPSLELPPPTSRSSRVTGRAGTPVAAPWLARERRNVTVVVAEVAVANPGTDPEARARATRSAIEAGTDVLRRHGGRVDEFLGDTVVGFFGLPVAHEDDAYRAVRAAVELRAAGLSTRTGIETGEVVVGAVAGTATPTRVSGPVLSTAARLCAAAAPGEAIAGSVTQRLISGSVVVEPAKDLRIAGDDLIAWRVLDVVAGAPALARRLDAAMCGRQHELSLLRTSFRRTIRSGHASLFTVVGEAGIGKTRLARGFVESIGSDARVIMGRCPSYGEGITFLPLREALASIGLDLPDASPAALFPAIRRLLENLAAEHPLIVVFDDVHWAEPTLIELIEYVGRTATGPLFLLCLTRPEFFEERRSPAAGNVLELEPLAPTDVEELIGAHTGASVHPAQIRRIVAMARGNPLFAEQLLAALSDGSLDDVPVSLQSLLAMRLDRLGPAERDLLRCAAVVGTDCDRDALTALLPDEAHPYVDRHIAALKRKRLIQPAPWPTLRFSHVLIQLAAYRSMTREDRARLHEHYADWLESAATPVADLAEIAGYHLEQAVVHRRASGLVDATLPALAARAGERLADAGTQAFARFDITAVENLLSRSRAVLPEDHPRRTLVTQRLAEVDLILGRFGEGQQLLGELIDQAGVTGNLSYQRSARLERARIQFIIGPDPVPLTAIRDEANAAAAHYAATGNAAGRGRAHFLLGCVLMREGRMVAAADAFRHSLSFADQVGDMREAMASRWMLAQVSQRGPVPVADCLDTFQDWATVLGVDHPGVMMESAVLLAMLSRFEEARQLTAQAREIVLEQMRVRRLLRFVAEANAAVEMLAEEYAAAENEFRTDMDLATETDEAEPLALAAAGLATALLAQGKADEAAAFAAMSAEAAPAEAAAAHTLSRAALARVSSAAGDHAEAVRLAREAVRTAPGDMLNLHADTLVYLADVLRAAGQPNNASAALAEAARLYERKGNIAALARIQLFQY
jgi:DNA-binding SARP family transcriptional activator/tetratricopeptide (TPR) repeat protein